jgi:hypothetical protein
VPGHDDHCQIEVDDGVLVAIAFVGGRVDVSPNNLTFCYLSHSDRPLDKVSELAKKAGSGPGHWIISQLKGSCHLSQITIRCERLARDCLECDTHR